MTELPHERLALRAAAELADRGDVHAVLLAGSVVRGEHRASSDIDLLVVGPEATDLPVRHVTEGTLVERISHSEDGWVSRFDRPRTSWLYAFHEARILVDDGAGGRLRELAAHVRTHYRASEELRRTVATGLWHSRAKLERARHSDDLTRGFWAAICIEYILNGLYTIHDVPLPAGSRLIPHVSEVPLTTGQRDGLHRLLTGSTPDRLRAATELTEELLALLGPADHEVPR